MKDIQSAIGAMEKGISLSSESSGLEWKNYAVEFLREYCVNNQTVFVDDLWVHGLVPPKSPRALGSVILHATKNGWLVEQKSGGCVLARPSANSNMQLKRVWLSTIYICPELN